ncbi:histone-lysine N-trimethyltransferase SMYD5 isoform X1 [Patella vulgata]|uniref:histone-lysine N-trimethyltransferase SMYD5 isoform X1 n=2 Tax=Patella vulgata TaxID=6465 RepID=UPI00218031E3|nr:histone-lysine N-trimethyltransferase SMYD5 isoform X1 [Patella vulgata]
MAASSGLNVEAKFIDSSKGRGLFSKQDIKEGETILDETPLVSTQFLWNELYKYQACEYCLRSIEKAEAMTRRLANNPALTLPFPECCEVKTEQIVVCPQCQMLYCSEECRKASWDRHHQVLCLGSSSQDSDHPLARLQEIWRNIHYPPETASIMLICKMIAMVKQTSDPGSMVHSFNQFVKSTVNEEQQIAHKLLGQEFKDQLELLRSTTAEILFDDSIQQWFTPEGFQSLFALIGTNGQGIGTSSISVWVKNCDELSLPEDKRKELDDFIDKMYEELENEAGMFLNCEGAGLYQLTSSCNHSCEPNASITFPYNNHISSLVALKDIHPEEEIFISYINECERSRSRHSRQKILRENYIFNCHCKKCNDEADQPDVTSEEDMESDEEADEMDNN